MEVVTIFQGERRALLAINTFELPIIEIVRDVILMISRLQKKMV